MAPLDYLVLRTIRYFMPPSWTKWLLRRRWIIKPGLETRDPRTASARYLDFMHRHDRSVEGTRVFILGYGGRFDVAVALLEAGAESVTLSDPFAAPDVESARRLERHHPGYVDVHAGQVRILDARLILLDGDVRATAGQGDPGYSLVLSSSVYEHLDDPAEITRALASITSKEGFHIHFIDLRDHFFKYPFEMLCHEEQTWKRFLNPSSNLNRFRIPDYEAVFSECFTDAVWEVLSSDQEAFRRVRHRILPQYLTGSDELDAITRIVYAAWNPRPTA